MKRLFIGNLPFKATESEIRKLFESFTTVRQVDLVIDRETNRPRGFGFVEVEAEDVASVIGSLNGKEFGGRTLRISEAHDRERSQGQERRRR